MVSKAVAASASGLAFASLLAGGAIALAENAANNLCFKDGAAPAARIASCTALIQSKKQSTQDLARALTMRGTLYGDQDQYARAIDDFDQSLRLDSNLSLTYFQRANAYWLKGVHGGTVADEHQAIADFTRYIRMNPLPPECLPAYHNRDHAYRSIRDFSGAIADYTAEIELHPAFSIPRRYRADMYVESGELSLAVTDYTEVIRQDGKDQQAYLNRANVYLKLGDFDHAIADIDIGLPIAKQNISDVPAYLAKFYIVRGTAHKSTKQYELSVADFTEALRLDADARTYVLRAMTYLASGEKERAIADLNESLRRNPDNASTWNDRCWVEAMQDELAYAFRDCNQALKLAPKDIAALDSRGLVNLKIGNLNDAIVDYNAALNIKSEFPSSLYGRGIAKNKKAPHSGDADIAAAIRLSPQIESDFASYGLK